MYQTSVKSAGDECADVVLVPRKSWTDRRLVFYVGLKASSSLYAKKKQAQVSIVLKERNNKKQTCTKSKHKGKTKKNVELIKMEHRNDAKKQKAKTMEKRRISKRRNMKFFVQAIWLHLYVHVPRGPLIFCSHGNFVFAWSVKNKIAVILLKPSTVG